MHRKPLALTLLTLPFLLLLNPLFLLQGCFMRCPEVLPYNSSAEQKTTAQKLDQTISIVSDDGVLELQLYQTSLFDDSPRFGALRALDLIAPAHATPSCQRSDPPPSTYRLSTLLRATWIPSEGEALTIVEDLALHDKIDHYQASSGSGTITLNYAQNDQIFQLNLVANQERYQLSNGRILTTVEESRWDITFSDTSITNFTRE